MPIRPSEQARYPPDWPVVRVRILTRADNRCEFDRADGTRCNAPNRTIIARSLEDPEKWFDFDEALNGLPSSQWYAVQIVLTIAHLDHVPEHCSDDNLKAACQLHHLRYDAEQHRIQAAITRRSKLNNLQLEF